MTAKAALCKLFLEGQILTIKNCFNLVGITNLPREASRQIEQPFNIRLSRIQRKGVSKYGQPVTWYEYRLNKDAPENQEGIQKMRDYVAEHTKTLPEYKQKYQQIINPLFQD